MLGALIGAGASLLGGLMGKSSADKQMDMQKKFAKNAIQWKVEDAKKAGISPIYALGANTVSYSPTGVGDPLGQGIANAGQDIGRAVNATATDGERSSAFSHAVQSLQLEGMKLDNEMKRAELVSKIATRNATGIPPPFPGLEGTFIAGQGNAEEPFRVQKTIAASQPGMPESEAGKAPEIAWYESKTGSVPQIPQALSESFEGEPLHLSGLQWFLRNKIMPMASPAYFNPPYKAKANEYWTYNPILGQYELHQMTAPRRHLMYPDWLYNDGRG